MDILRSLPKRLSIKKLVIVMSDCYKKLTKAVSACKATALHIYSLFIEHRVILCEILFHLLTDNGTWFISKVFSHYVPS